MRPDNVRGAAATGSVDLAEIHLIGQVEMAENGLSVDFNPLPGDCLSWRYDVVESMSGRPHGK